MSSVPHERTPSFPRHRTDFFALFAGVMFAALGVGFLLDATEAWDADVTWVLPVVLIALGLGGILTTVTRPGTSAPEGRHEAGRDETN